MKPAWYAGVPAGTLLQPCVIKPLAVPFVQAASFRATATNTDTILTILTPQDL